MADTLHQIGVVINDGDGREQRVRAVVPLGIERAVPIAVLLTKMF